MRLRIDGRPVNWTMKLFWIRSIRVLGFLGLFWVWVNFRFKLSFKFSGVGNYAFGYIRVRVG